MLLTLPKTNSKFASENGWLEYDRFLWGKNMNNSIFGVELFVSGRVTELKLHRVDEKTLDNLKHIYLVRADMGVSKNRGTPKWMVKTMENPIKMG